MTEPNELLAKELRHIMLGRPIAGLGHITQVSEPDHSGNVMVMTSKGLRFEIVVFDRTEQPEPAALTMHCSCHEALGHMSSCDYWHHPSSRSCELLKIWEPGS